MAAAKVQSGYEQVQQSLYAKPYLGVQQSGTTATVVVHDHVQDKLLVSHVGDSSAVIVRSVVGTAHKVEGARLTRDHKPELSDERERIEKHGRVVYDGVCHRVVKKVGAGPGLAMSRSLGDDV